MSDFSEIMTVINKFNSDRNWSQFHDSKNLASAISIEAAELNELFLWKSAGESEVVNLDKIRSELADVLVFSFILADKHGLDISEIILDKVKRNELRYPIEKSKDSAKKYNEL